MVITKLKGGLGNQMFQYAHGRAFALEKNQKMLLDTSWYEKKSQESVETKRTYGLQNFNIEENTATPEDLIKFQKLTIFQKIIRKIRVKILKSSLSSEYNVVQNKGSDFLLDGYWQNEKYFKSAEETVRKEFTLKLPLGNAAQNIANQINENSVSLHMRNTDYFLPSNSAIFAKCTPEYYEKAVEIIAGKIQNPHLFVFSDDIEIAKKDLKINFPVTYVSNPEIKDFEELVLMSRCSHNIIANSSFSWWGAWLNPNKNKTVVGPAKWYNNPKSNMNEAIPPTWIKI